MWRKLEVEVTSEVVRAWWGENRQLVGTLTREWTAKHAALSLRDLKNLPAKEYYLNNILSCVAPRGSVGLVVSRGSASFRNVVIEPLGSTK